MKKGRVGRVAKVVFRDFAKIGFQKVPKNVVSFFGQFLMPEKQEMPKKHEKVEEGGQPFSGLLYPSLSFEKLLKGRVGRVALH